MNQVKRTNTKALLCVREMDVVELDLAAAALVGVVKLEGEGVVLVDDLGLDLEQVEHVLHVHQRRLRCRNGVQQRQQRWVVGELSVALLWVWCTAGRCRHCVRPRLWRWQSNGAAADEHAVWGGTQLERGVVLGKQRQLAAPGSSGSRSRTSSAARRAAQRTGGEQETALRLGLAGAT